MSEDLIKRLRRKALDIKLLHKGSLQLKHSELLKSLYHTQMPQVYDSHHDAHIDDSDEKWIQFKTRYPIDRLNDYSDLDQIQFEISSGDSTYDEIENRNIPTHSVNKDVDLVVTEKLQENDNLTCFQEKIISSSHAQDDPELLPIQDDATFKSELTSPDETSNQIQDEDDLNQSKEVDDSVALQDLNHSKPILVHTGSSQRADDDVSVQSESKSLDAPLLGLENGDLTSQSANHALDLEEDQDKNCTEEELESGNPIEDELESGDPIEDDEEQDEEEGSDNDDLGSDAAEQDQKETEDQLSDREDARLNTTEKSDVSTQAIQSASFEPDDILEPTQHDLLDADDMGDEEDGTDVDRNDEADDILHKGQGNDVEDAGDGDQMEDVQVPSYSQVDDESIIVNLDESSAADLKDAPGSDRVKRQRLSLDHLAPDRDGCLAHSQDSDHLMRRKAICMRGKAPVAISLKPKIRSESYCQYKGYNLQAWRLKVISRPLTACVNTSTKTVTTKDWQLVREEIRQLRILGRIDQLKSENLWSFKQMKPHKPVSQPRTHRDYLLDEMKWVYMDFRQERKWKLATAYTMAQWVLEWHQAVDKSTLCVKRRFTSESSMMGIIGQQSPQHIASLAVEVTDEMEVVADESGCTSDPTRTDVHDTMGSIVDVKSINTTVSADGLVTSLPVSQCIVDNTTSTIVGTQLDPSAVEPPVLVAPSAIQPVMPQCSTSRPTAKLVTLDLEANVYYVADNESADHALPFLPCYGPPQYDEKSVVPNIESVVPVSRYTMQRIVAKQPSRWNEWGCLRTQCPPVDLVKWLPLSSRYHTTPKSVSLFDGEVDPLSGILAMHPLFKEPRIPRPVVSKTLEIWSADEDEALWSFSTYYAFNWTIIVLSINAARLGMAQGRFEWECCDRFVLLVEQGFKPLLRGDYLYSAPLKPGKSTINDGKMKALKLLGTFEAIKKCAKKREMSRVPLVKPNKHQVSLLAHETHYQAQVQAGVDPSQPPMTPLELSLMKERRDKPMFDQHRMAVFAAHSRPGPIMARPSFGAASANYASQLRAGTPTAAANDVSLLTRNNDSIGNFTGDQIQSMLAARQLLVSRAAASTQQAEPASVDVPATIPISPSVSASVGGDVSPTTTQRLQAQRIQKQQQQQFQAQQSTTDKQAAAEQQQQQQQQHRQMQADVF
ncbi:hypothetical protein BASA83_000501 [Batrachochytrium salamandrivorans]|nr:hypothetical protein BASA83_000501 [Batrachochytrium salamandrivorans]